MKTPAGIDGGAPVGRSIDSIDRGIIGILRENPQATNKEIARKVGISEATASNRIDALISDRLIRITVQRDVRTLGLQILAHVEVDVDGSRLESIARELGTFERVFAVTVVIGSPQVVMLVFARNAEDLHRFVSEEIAGVDGVRRADVAIALRTTKADPSVAALQ